MTEPTTHPLSPRLRELSDAVTQGREAVAREFTMRVPAEPNRDADLVLSRAADELDRQAAEIARLRADVGATARPQAARPLAEWHDDKGAALWWRFPVDEPPYCGTPLDGDWPGYHTHWTPIVVPASKHDAARNAEGRSDG